MASWDILSRYYDPRVGQTFAFVTDKRVNRPGAAGQIVLKLQTAWRDAELEARGARRDIEAELIESANQTAQGKTSVAYSAVIAARKGSGLSQSRFAALLADASCQPIPGGERRHPSLCTN